MQLILIIILFSTITAILSIVYNKNFLLSILIALESILLNLIMLNILSSFNINNSIGFSLSLFLLTLSAIEASIGISILALITRNFNTNSIYSINLLKN
uniref:NADH-ubiquinone oxidoreductase chain 4L n=1 Tax=Ophiura sarsii TaxID=861515 RepID=A0A5J6BSC0_9ECHI|nr:NADH dehydrogenase subunit 4L [Ophiura sarsii]QEP94699.1 NADH dehydrogenase subunit 4L [Ophiura sarsii]QHT54196.1 NADH dehydrogenase subunit 4L [Ophiura sarsii]QYF07882.1 NADH dehydrogenase subunit 4 [Ophiura sarsii]